MRRILEQAAKILEDRHFIRTLPRLLENLTSILENILQIKNTEWINHARLSIRYFKTIFPSTVCGRIVESFDKALQTVALNYLPVPLLA